MVRALDKSRLTLHLVIVFIVSGLLISPSNMSAQAPEPTVLTRYVSGTLTPGDGYTFDVGVRNNGTAPIVVSKVEIVDILEPTGQCGREWFGDAGYTNDPSGSGRPYPLPSVTPAAPVVIASGAVELIGQTTLYMIYAAGNECQNVEIQIVFRVTWQPQVIASPSATAGVTPSVTPTATDVPPTPVTPAPTDPPAASPVVTATAPDSGIGDNSIEYIPGESTSTGNDSGSAAQPGNEGSTVSSDSQQTTTTTGAGLNTSAPSNVKNLPSTGVQGETNNSLGVFVLVVASLTALAAVVVMRRFPSHR